VGDLGQHADGAGEELEKSDSESGEDIDLMRVAECREHDIRMVQQTIRRAERVQCISASARSSDHYAECPARPAPMFGSSGSAITQSRVYQ
jgi:hypothetical protein